MSVELGQFHNILPLYNEIIFFYVLEVNFSLQFAFSILVASTIYVDIQHYNYDCKGVNLKLELVVGV